MLPRKLLARAATGLPASLPALRELVGPGAKVVLRRAAEVLAVVAAAQQVAAGLRMHGRLRRCLPAAAGLALRLWRRLHTPRRPVAYKHPEVCISCPKSDPMLRVNVPCSLAYRRLMSGVRRRLRPPRSS